MCFDLVVSIIRQTDRACFDWGEHYQWASNQNKTKSAHKYIIYVHSMLMLLTVQEFNGGWLGIAWQLALSDGGWFGVLVVVAFWWWWQSGVWWSQQQQNSQHLLVKCSQGKATWEKSVRWLQSVVQTTMTPHWHIVNSNVGCLIAVHSDPRWI